MPHTYYPLLVRPTQLVDLASPEFGTADGTFKVTQKGNEIFFDLGFEQRKRKTGIYKDGALQVYSGALNRATLPQKECATVLNMLADCTRIVDCSELLELRTILQWPDNVISAHLKICPYLKQTIFTKLAPRYARPNHRRPSNSEPCFVDIDSK